MGQRVFVTGGSGFVGTAVIEELLRRDHSVVALVRDAEKSKLPATVRTVEGDLFDPAVLAQGMAGCDAVIHLVGIIMEQPAKGVTFEHVHVDGTRSIVEAAGKAGIPRYVHMSALGSRPDAPSNYHKTKFRAEEIVRASASAWTIFRPSMIHGPRGEFMRMEADWAKKKSLPYLFMPYFGAGVLGAGGAGKLQPIFVGDVARAFVEALENEKSIGQVYELAGSEVLTWPEMHRKVSQAIVGKRRLTMPIPAWYASALTRILPASLLPFNRDQILMSQEDNTGDLSKLSADFGWSPGSFTETLAVYADQMKK